LAPVRVGELGVSAFSSANREKKILTGTLRGEFAAAHDQRTLRCGSATGRPAFPGPVRKEIDPRRATAFFRKSEHDLEPTSAENKQQNAGPLEIPNAVGADLRMFFACFPEKSPSTYALIEVYPTPVGVRKSMLQRLGKGSRSTELGTAPTARLPHATGMSDV